MIRTGISYLHHSSLSVLIVLAISLIPAHSPAQAPGRDVPAHSRATAAKLFELGNRHLNNSAFHEAVAMYREALRVAEHPSIYYNLALALTYLNRPLEAHQTVLRGLGLGGGLLTSETREKLQEHQRKLEKKLSLIVIVCSQSDAVVALDGEPLSMVDGTVTLHVLPGKHSVTARKPDYLPITREITAQSGSQSSVELTLMTMAETRRWPQWKPWVVVGAGVATGLVGGLLQWQSSVEFQQFDNAFSEKFPEGEYVNAVPAELRQQQANAERYNQAAIGAFIGSAVILASGVTLVLLNRPRSDRLDEHHRPGLVVTPFLSPDTNGVAVGLSLEMRR